MTVCARKKPYHCRAAAKKAAKWATQRFKRKTVLYKCPTCNQFHLATKTDGDYERRPWADPLTEKAE